MSPTPRLPDGYQTYAALIEVCRRDFYSFAMLCLAELNPGAPILHNYHLEALAFRLTQVINGQCQNLMINMPPRYAKSIFTSIALPAYLLGHQPTRQVLVISHSLDLASKLSNAFRRIVNAPWYKEMFPNTQFSRDTEYEVTTTKGGCRRAASISGSLTGLGGDPLILDDPLNAADAYSEITRQRVNELVRLALARRDNKKNGAAILAMQRLHAFDPCGSLLSEPGHGFTVLRLAAIAEEDEIIPIGEDRFYHRRAGEALHAEREPIDVLERIKAQVGSAIFAEQYQQSPAPRDGFIFKRAWLHVVGEPPPRTSNSMIIQSLDTAIKTGQENDYSACSTVMIQDGHYCIIGAVRVRLEFPDLVKFAKSQAQNEKPTRILVEDSGLGTPLVKELQRVGLPALPVKPECNKIARMKAQTVKFEAGKVSFVRQAFTPELEAEFLSVPNSRHDDLVDSICQALAYAPNGSTYNWDAITNRNFQYFVEGLAFARFFGP
jgi:predicted phage terminase large subunit-like protein